MSVRVIIPPPLPRARLRFDGLAEPDPWEFDSARTQVLNSRALEVLGPKLKRSSGPRRGLGLEPLLVAAQVNALRPAHRAHLKQITRVLTSFSPSQRLSLGMGPWDPGWAIYLKGCRLVESIARVLDSGFETELDGLRIWVDTRWWLTNWIEASLPADLLVSSVVAIDSTDLPSWGRLHGELEYEDLDSDLGEDEWPVEQLAAAKAKRARAKHRAKVFGIGPDGRNQYLEHDADARAGWRTATNKRPAGFFIGCDLHTFVQAREIEWTDGVERITLGPPVCRLIRGAVLVPALTHRANTVVPALIDAKERGHELSEVIADAGYTLLAPDTFFHPLHEAGIEVTFRSASHQRNPKPFVSGTDLIDGGIFISQTPEELRELPMPPYGATKEEREPFIERFNQRAQYRYSFHGGPDSDGTMRLISPFRAGRLRSRQIPRTMRSSRPTPLVELPGGSIPATVSIAAIDLPLRQRCVFGTSAWDAAYGRRQVVESVNGALKEGFVDMGDGFLHVFGSAKIAFLLGFTLAGHNINEARTFRERQIAAGDDPPRRRARRRKGTYEDILGSRTASGRSRSVEKSGTASGSRGPPGAGT